MVRDEICGVSVNALKNCCSHFQLILCGSWFIISPPILNFIQIVQKTQKLEIFTFGRFWLVGLAGRKMVVGILSVFCPIISPHTKFHPNRMKNTEVENFHYWSILVGLAVWSKNGLRFFAGWLVGPFCVGEIGKQRYFVADKNDFLPKKIV